MTQTLTILQTAEAHQIPLLILLLLLLNIGFMSVCQLGHAEKENGDGGKLLPINRENYKSVVLYNVHFDVAPPQIRTH